MLKWQGWRFLRQLKIIPFIPPRAGFYHQLWSKETTNINISKNTFIELWKFQVGAANSLRKWDFFGKTGGSLEHGIFQARENARWLPNAAVSGRLNRSVNTSHSAMIGMALSTQLSSEMSSPVSSFNSLSAAVSSCR